MLRRPAVMLALPLVLAVIGGGAVLAARNALDAPGALPTPRAVVVPHGGLAAVAAALHDAGVIKHPLLLRVFAMLTLADGTLHAAEFEFPAHGTLRQVLSVLRVGRPVQHHFTIPEGFSSAQIAEALDRAPGLTGPSDVPPEGAVLPQTYDYEFGTPRAVMLGRAEVAMQRVLQREWDARDVTLPLAAPEQALILASIVERETGRSDERPRVAAVFLNRLRIGMRLQSDPTVIYAVSGGLSLERPISRTDLDQDNPYNTYRVQGLPPGPICSPGLAALRAVLHPAATDDLYFVADGDGGHNFSRTLDAHVQNVAHWRDSHIH